jgi:hypothetical protein
MEKKIIFPPRYYANCVSTTLKVLILHNVESVYFFYSNPVYYKTKFVECGVKENRGVAEALTAAGCERLNLQIQSGPRKLGPPSVCICI